ncbi:hypothetical protein [Bosea vaviloviae]|nr:hypothetical protein [Bosea vaviloviae]
MSFPASAGVFAGLSVLVLGSAHAQPLDDVLECSGPFAKDMDEAALVKAFGAQNFVRADIDIGELTTEPGTVIFPTHAKRRIEVLWHDMSERRRPRSITVRHASTWTIAARFPDQRRLTVGTPLAQVEAINGKPFLLFGFGWDNGGYAVGWEGGALKNAVACNLFLRFEPDPKAKDSALSKASGGKQFKSSSPAMRAVRPTVSSISLGWPE